MSPTPNAEPQGSFLKTALVAGALIALLGVNVYLYLQIEGLRTETAANMAKTRTSILAELGSLRDASSVTTAAQKQHLENLKQDLELARSQAKGLASQAKAEATARAEQLAKQIEVEQAKVQQQMNTEISSVKESAATANTKIGEVNTEVGTVKTLATSTKSELDKTIAELKSVKGDLGVQSGLIATNGSELSALRRLGERNYIEFKLGKTKEPQRVGDIALKLQKVDLKRNRFTVDVMADDKLTQKKDKTINEPVQFYTSKAKQPYEMVVNQVSKDQIVGYLSVPKVLSNGR